MLSYEKSIPLSGQTLVVGFDLEWTKNYKIKNPVKLLKNRLLKE